MKRQWKQMKPQKKPSRSFDFGLCFYCQQNKPTGFWVYCSECLQKVPEVQAKMAYINARLREKYGGLEFGDI